MKQSIRIWIRSVKNHPELIEDDVLNVTQETPFGFAGAGKGFTDDILMEYGKILAWKIREMEASKDANAHHQAKLAKESEFGKYLLTKAGGTVKRSSGTGTLKEQDEYAQTIYGQWLSDFWDTPIKAGAYLNGVPGALYIAEVGASFADGVDGNGGRVISYDTYPFGKAQEADFELLRKTAIEMFEQEDIKLNFNHDAIYISKLAEDEVQVLIKNPIEATKACAEVKAVIRNIKDLSWPNGIGGNSEFEAQREYYRSEVVSKLRHAIDTKGLDDKVRVCANLLITDMSKSAIEGLTNRHEKAQKKAAATGRPISDFKRSDDFFNTHLERSASAVGNMEALFGKVSTNQPVVVVSNDSDIDTTVERVLKARFGDRVSPTVVQFLKQARNTQSVRDSVLNVAA